MEARNHHIFGMMSYVLRQGLVPGLFNTALASWHQPHIDWCNSIFRFIMAYTTELIVKTLVAAKISIKQRKQSWLTITHLRIFDYPCCSPVLFACSLQPSPVSSVRPGTPPRFAEDSRWDQQERRSGLSPRHARRAEPGAGVRGEPRRRLSGQGVFKRGMAGHGVLLRRSHQGNQFVQ